MYFQLVSISESMEEIRYKQRLPNMRGEQSSESVEDIRHKQRPLNMRGVHALTFAQSMHARLLLRLNGRLQ